MDFQNPLNESKLASIRMMLMTRPNYKIIQENGQRLYGPPTDTTGTPVMDPPARGSEVFIGRLPRNCYEDELVPVFEKVGLIYQLRLMMDFSGTNRGFAFVQYSSRDQAREAVKSLDGCEVRTGHSIGVMLSWDNRRLFVGGIPKNRNKRQIMNEMRRVTDGVKDVIVYKSVYNNKNRGFAFVEYDTHYKAAMARRKLSPGFRLWVDCEIRVDWAEPEPEIDEETMRQVKILHVRNLHPNEEESTLKQLFGFDGLHVERVKKIRDFAFIHYESREDAETAINFIRSNRFSEQYDNYRQIQVSWARPNCKTKPYKTRSSSLLSSQNLIQSPINSPQLNTPYFMHSTPLTHFNLNPSPNDYSLPCLHNNPMPAHTLIPVNLTQHYLPVYDQIPDQQYSGRLNPFNPFR